LAKTFGEPCPICEAARKAKGDEAKKWLPAPNPISFYNIEDAKGKKGKVMVFGANNYFFESEVWEEIRTDEDTDEDITGIGIKFRAAEGSFEGRPFIKFKAFSATEGSASEKAMKNAFPLDKMIKHPSYEQIEAIFDGSAEDKDDDDDDDKGKGGGSDLTLEDLKDMSMKKLKALARENDLRVKKDDDKDDLIEKICKELDIDPDDDDKKGEDKDDDDDDKDKDGGDEDDKITVEELRDMSLKKLKKFATENRVRLKKDMDEDEIIEAICEKLDIEIEEEGSDDDEEPDFDDMSLGDLKDYAKEKYGIKSKKSDKRKDVMKAIEKKKGKDGDDDDDDDKDGGGKDNKKKKCPSGHVFGKDCNQKEECPDCPTEVFDNCANEYDKFQE
jgi:hypothetical protein